MGIGERIKKLRKTEMLKQQDFAERLGIKQGYITMLETGKNIPSDQLILSICREYRVRIEWLKDGEGGMYDLTPRFTPKGHVLIEEINKKLVSPDKPVPLSTVAKILGIDPDNPGKDTPLNKDLSNGLTYFLQIFKENDKTKINAVLAQLKALLPRKQ